MGGVVGVELDLGEQHDTPAPVEGVLVEVIRRRLLLAGALVVGQRIRLTLLAQDVDLKFGSSFQPTLKVVHEMGFREIQARRRGRRWRERSEEHTSELQSPCNLVCRLLLEKKKKISITR